MKKKQLMSREGENGAWEPYVEKPVDIEAFDVGVTYTYQYHVIEIDDGESGEITEGENG